MFKVRLHFKKKCHQVDINQLTKHFNVDILFNLNVLYYIIIIFIL